MRIFDLAPPLQYLGAAASRKSDLEAWFKTWDGPIGYEIRDMKIETFKASIDLKP